MSFVSQKHIAIDEAHKAISEFCHIPVQESGMERITRMQHLYAKLRDAKIEFKVAQKDEEVGQLNLNLFK